MRGCCCCVVAGLLLCGFCSVVAVVWWLFGESGCSRVVLWQLLFFQIGDICCDGKSSCCGVFDLNEEREEGGGRGGERRGRG